MSLAEDTVFLSKGRELVYHWHCATREDATEDIFEYIEVFIIERVVTQPSAMTPQPSTKRGRGGLTRVHGIG